MKWQWLKCKIIESISNIYKEKMLFHSSPTIWVALHFSVKAFLRSREFVDTSVWHLGWRKSTGDQTVPTVNELQHHHPWGKGQPLLTYKMQQGRDNDYSSVGSLTCSDIAEQCPHRFHVHTQ